MWKKLNNKLPPVKKHITDSRIVCGFIDYSLDHCRIIYPGKYQVNFTFDSKDELAKHVWARVKLRSPLFVDEDILEKERLAMKEEVAKYDRSPINKFFSWLRNNKLNTIYGNLMYRLGKFFREQGDKAMNPKEYKWRNKYVYYKNYETNAIKKKRKKQSKPNTTPNLGTL